MIVLFIVLSRNKPRIPSLARFSPSCDKIAYVGTDGKPYVVNYPAMTNGLLNNKVSMDSQTGQALAWANDNSFYYTRNGYMRIGIIHHAYLGDSRFWTIISDSNLIGNPGQIRGLSLSNDKTRRGRARACSRPRYRP